MYIPVLRVDIKFKRRNNYVSEVNSSAVNKTCDVSSSAVQLVMLTTHGTAYETICDVSTRAVQLVQLTAQLVILAVAQ